MSWCVRHPVRVLEQLDKQRIALMNGAALFHPRQHRGDVRLQQASDHGILRLSDGFDAVIFEVTTCRLISARCWTDW